MKSGPIPGSAMEVFSGGEIFHDKYSHNDTVLPQLFEKGTKVAVTHSLATSTFYCLIIIVLN